MKIDSHHHFWKYSAQEYAWISDSMDVLRRDFMPEDILQEMHSNGIDGFITVQARQSLEETEWLLELASSHSFIKGVVGWLPLASPDAERHIEFYSSNPLLKGVRHVIQDEADENFILRKDFNNGISLLKNYSLVYDILIFERQLPIAVKFSDMHPGQILVLDHIAKPAISKGLKEPWKSNICRLAERENVYCKVSGLVTESGKSDWTFEELLPYLETVLEAFGPSRLLFGSDWPVCLCHSSYGRWLETVKNFISKLSASEQDSIMGLNAMNIYKSGEII